MSTAPKEEIEIEPTHTVELPVVVEADYIHKRYCASIVRNGQVDHTLYGEHYVGDNWIDDKERKIEHAINDLRTKLLLKLGAASDK